MFKSYDQNGVKIFRTDEILIRWKDWIIKMKQFRWLGLTDWLVSSRLHTTSYSARHGARRKCLAPCRVFPSHPAPPRRPLPHAVWSCMKTTRDKSGYTDVSIYTLNIFLACKLSDVTKQRSLERLWLVVPWVWGPVQTTLDKFQKRFQIPPVWKAFSTSSVFVMDFCVDGRPKLRFQISLV